VAQRLGIPSVLHEQNKRLGLANRLLAPRASKLLLSFPETAGEFPDDRAIVVGNPVRSGFLSPLSREEGCARLGIDSAVPTVLAGDVLLNTPGGAEIRNITAMPMASVVYDRYDKPAFTLFDERRFVVPLERISPHLIQAVLAVEPW